MRAINDNNDVNYRSNIPILDHGNSTRASDDDGALVAKVMTQAVVHIIMCNMYTVVSFSLVVPRVTSLLLLFAGSPVHDR